MRFLRVQTALAAVPRERISASHISSDNGKHRHLTPYNYV